MSQLVYGIFNDEDVLMNAIKPLKSKGLKIKDVISPFPIHGLDHALGLKETRISIACFIYGVCGCSLGLLMMWYMNVYDWPMDIGGKPNYAFMKNFPSWIPVMFECTVLCAAHGMVLTFFLRSKILPGVTAHVIHPRMADDHFVMAIEVKDNTKTGDATALLKEYGAVEIK